MDKTPGDKIIQEVSIPLAQVVFQKDFDAETGEALRAKTLELLLALDVLASASHDLAQISDTAFKFKNDFEKKFDTNFMKENVFQDFQNLKTETQDFTMNSNFGSYPRKVKRISGVSRVEKGEITEVTIINPDKRSGNPNEAPFLAESHAAETNKQKQFRDEHLRFVQENIHAPLRAVTTMEKMGKNGGNPDTSLSKSFLTDSSFTGVLNDTDKKAIGEYADKHKLTVQTSEKNATEYMKTLSEKSNKNQKKIELEEQKRSNEIETETSKEETPTATNAGSAPAPTVMVTGGGGGGGSFGGGSFGGGSFSGGGGTFGGGGRQNASFDKNRRKNGDTKAMLENAEKDGEIDIDKLLSDMLEENKKEGENATIEGVTSSLPEGSYSVVNGPDGKPLGYRVNEELGGGVFLFDPDSGKSTALMMTNKDNVFMNPETGKYYQMDFPDQPDTTSSETTSSDSGTSPVITEIESDAEPVKKEVTFSSLDQDMLQDQGLLRTIKDGETFYSHYENGQIVYMVDDTGKRVDQSIIDEINGSPSGITVENASLQTFEIPPSLSEVFQS